MVGNAPRTPCRPTAQRRISASATVPLDDKQRLVDDVFHFRRAPLRPDERPDVGRACIGSGRMRLSRSCAHRPAGAGGGCSTLPAGPATSPCARWRRAAERCATVADINPDMLAVGRERAASRAFAGRIEFVETNAEALPFADRHFDAVTIAFGIRNVPRVETALGEMLRVLKLGGRFLCLEFSQVDVPALDGALRCVLVARDPGARPRRYRRRGILSLPRGIDSPLSQSRSVRRHDAQSWLRRVSRRRRSRAASSRSIPAGGSEVNVLPPLAHLLRVGTRWLRARTRRSICSRRSGSASAGAAAGGKNRARLSSAAVPARVGAARRGADTARAAPM